MNDESASPPMLGKGSKAKKNRSSNNGKKDKKSSKAAKKELAALMDDSMKDPTVGSMADDFASLFDL